MMLSGVPGVAFQRWLFDNPQKGNVLIGDLGQHVNGQRNFTLTCAKPMGRYRFIWIDGHCSEMRLELLDDRCAERSSLFNKLVFKRKECRRPHWSQGTCHAPAGNVWYSQAPFTGDASKPREWMTIVSDGYNGFLERHGNVTIFGAVTIDKDASTFLDIGSVPNDDHCRDLSGSYRNMYDSDKVDSSESISLLV